MMFYEDLKKKVTEENLIKLYARLLNLNDTDLELE